MCPVMRRNPEAEGKSQALPCGHSCRTPAPGRPHAECPAVMPCCCACRKVDALPAVRHYIVNEFGFFANEDSEEPHKACSDCALRVGEACVAAAAELKQAQPVERLLLLLDATNHYSRATDEEAGKAKSGELRGQLGQAMWDTYCDGPGTLRGVARGCAPDDFEVQAGLVAQAKASARGGAARRACLRSCSHLCAVMPPRSRCLSLQAPRTRLRSAKPRCAPCRARRASG